MLTSLLLAGACSAPQPIVTSTAQDCPTVIVPAPELVPIPAELVQLNENPAVPSQGDNAALLDWAMECAVNNRKYENQMKRLRGLSDE
jgi:hypothetical protein